MNTATPITTATFAEFALHPAILTAVHAAGYSEPTPIQSQAIPVVLSGKDVMGLAQTGTGKTAAFVLPIVHRLSKSQAAPRAGRQAPRALIIVPTRELAEQVNEVVEQFGQPLNLRTTTIYGGVSIHRQVEILRRGVDIIVACPGRLLDHLNQRTVDLSHVEVLVLDEADQMFDMGFLPNIRRLVKAVPTSRQSLLFSATMPSEIKELALQILQSPEIVRVSKIAPATSVTHALYETDGGTKVPLLLHLLETIKTDSVLIFTRTKHRTKEVMHHLSEAGHEVASLQGNLSQSRRKEAMDGFRAGRYRILVATDIAARGIDIASVSHVINFDMPSTVEAYTHRIGRTGRAAREGDAFTFVTREDQPMVRRIEHAMGTKIPFHTAADHGVVARSDRRFALRDSEAARYAPNSRPPSRGSRGPGGRAGQGGGGGGGRGGQQQDSYNRGPRSPREGGRNERGPSTARSFARRPQS